MRVDIFDFDLPRERIALEPATPRDHSRLLDLSEEDAITDRHFYDLPALLKPTDILVFNDTRVIPAKLYGHRGEAMVEITLYRPQDALNWWAFIKNAKRLKPADVITFYTQDISPSQSVFSATVIEKQDEEGVLLRFNCQPDQLNILLEQYGFMPLPPYIKRDKPVSTPQNTTDSTPNAQKPNLWDKFNDKESYQTIYAKHNGAVAAPTAGLHFTNEVLAQIEQKGIQKVFLTLHVGAGTFLPVKTEDTKDHKMHSEYGIITPEAAELINQAKQKGGRVIAVGTTSLRLLETAADDQGILHPFAGDTNIFITPGYKFKIIDMIITNFHLPKSTLFMLICAIAGTQRMKQAYQHAIEHQYRFFSYGDSSILKCINKINP